MSSTNSSAVTVSVITPCYNGARFLAQTLSSALGQTRPPLEVLVVDDGSTDDSATIAESFGPPVRVIRQANQGESVARNRALSEARGTHALFLDADDLLEKTSLERLAASVAVDPSAVAIMGCAWFADDPASPYETKLPAGSAFFPAIIESNLAPPHCWLVPTGVVARAGGFCADMRWYEDWDLWWRVGMLEPTLVPVQHLGALYRRHPGSQLATARLADQTRGHAQLMGRMATAFRDRPDLLRAHGDQLFWSCVIALRRARANHVPWAELTLLSDALRDIGSRGPETITPSLLSRTMRLFGVKAAVTMHAVMARG